MRAQSKPKSPNPNRPQARSPAACQPTPHSTRPLARYEIDPDQMKFSRRTLDGRHTARGRFDFSIALPSGPRASTGGASNLAKLRLSTRLAHDIMARQVSQPMIAYISICTPWISQRIRRQRRCSGKRSGHEWVASCGGAATWTFPDADLVMPSQNARSRMDCRGYADPGTWSKIRWDLRFGIDSFTCTTKTSRRIPIIPGIPGTIAKTKRRGPAPPSTHAKPLPAEITSRCR